MAEILFSNFALDLLGIEDVAESSLTALEDEIEAFAAREGCVGFVALACGKNTAALVSPSFAEVLKNGFRNCDALAIEDDRGSLEIHAVKDGRHVSTRVRLLTEEGYDYLLEARGYAYYVTKRKIVEEVFNNRRLSRKPYFALARKGVA